MNDSTNTNTERRYERRYIFYLRGPCPLCRQPAMRVLGDRPYFCDGGCPSKAIEQAWTIPALKDRVYWLVDEVELPDTEETRP